MRIKLKTPHVTTALEIPRERLQSWLNDGFIRPTVSKVGHGSRTIFSRDDVVSVAIFASLLSIGVNRELAAKVIRGLSKMKEPVEFLGFVPPKGPVFAIAPNQPLELNAVLGGAFDHLQIVNISRLAAHVDERLRNLSDFSELFDEVGLSELNEEDE